MNYKLILRLVGNVIRIETALMLLPFILSLAFRSGDYRAFLWSIGILAVSGTLLSVIKPEEKKFRAKEALVAVAFSWLAMSLFGAFPFYFSGYFNGWIDCVFESVSGFTTTGASLLTDIEALPAGILFWRSLSHWIGGMGVLLFILAVMPSMNASSVNLLRVESTGPSPGKIVPKIRETARILYILYFSLTGLLIALLCMTGLPVYDASVIAFSTAGTGGFSVLNASIAGYHNIAAEILITAFMFLFGINFSLYFMLLGKNRIKFFTDEELLTFFGLVALSITVVTINTFTSGVYGSIPEALRYSSFQVSSIISTTGFTTADFNVWPALSQTILILLMFVGSCGGSTGGGVKVIRLLLLFKAAKNETGRVFHPEEVRPITIGEKRVSSDIITKTAIYFFIYLAILSLAFILVSIEGKDVLSSLTAVIASLGNIGPGLGIAGPAGNYAAFTPLSKIVLCFCMLAGRLEFFPILTLFTASAWRRG